MNVKEFEKRVMTHGDYYYERSMEYRAESIEHKPNLLFCRPENTYGWLWLMRGPEKYHGKRWVLHDVSWSSKDIGEVDEELSDLEAVTLWKLEKGS